MTPLEDLIEQCSGPDGQRFRWLKNCKTYWLAQARPPHRPNMLPDITAVGNTPREALENLLKALNDNV